MSEQELLCRWAEMKYAERLVAPVLRVEIEDIHDSGWSEYTPGEGDGVRVCVFIDHGSRPAVSRDYFGSDMVGLIHDICRFAVGEE